jgi:hypothetical protein
MCTGPKERRVGYERRRSAAPRRRILQMRLALVRHTPLFHFALPRLRTLHRGADGSQLMSESLGHLSAMEYIAHCYARHVNDGHKIVVRSRVQLSIPSTLPCISNDDGQVWHQPFVVIRESDETEWRREMAPLYRIFPRIPPAAWDGPVYYYEVMAD